MKAGFPIVSFCLVAMPLCVFAAPPLRGTSLFGQVADAKSGEPVEAAVVELLDAEEKRLSYAVTDSSGVFSLLGAVGEVTLRVRHLAYVAAERKMTLRSDSLAVNLPPIALQASETTLAAAMATAEGKPIRYKEGNMVVVPSLLLGGERLDVAGVLKRLPGLSYSKQESLNYFGDAATVYIDGVKQSMPQQALHAYLSSLPAGAVKEISVMSNPPARYGKGPVVEIKLDKELSTGTIFTGTLNAAYHNKNIGDAEANLFYMTRTGKVTLNTVASYRNQEGFSESKDSLHLGNGISRVAHTLRGGRMHVGYLAPNLSWDMGKGNTLHVGVSAYVEGGTLPERVNDDEQQVLSHYFGDLYTLKVQYETSADKPFYASVGWSSSYGGRRTRSRYEYLSTGEVGFDADVAMRGYMHAFSVNLCNTFFQKKLSLFYGGEVAYNGMRNHALYAGDGAPVSSPAFEGKELLPSEYVTLVAQMGKLFSWCLKCRLDQSHYWYRLDGQSMTWKNPVQVSPYAHLCFEKGIYTGYLFAYWSRQYPNYNDMRFGERYVNELIAEQGNPYLPPTEALWYGLQNHFGPFMLQVIGCLGQNEHMSIMETREESVLFTQQVFGGHRLFRLRMGIPFRLFDGKLEGNVWGAGSWNEIINATPAAAPLVESIQGKFYGNATVNLTWEVTHDFLLSGNFAWWSRSATVGTVSLPGINLGLSASYAWRQFDFGVDATSILDMADPVRIYCAQDAELVRHQYRRAPAIQFSVKYNFLRGADVRRHYREYKPDTSRMTGE